MNKNKNYYLISCEKYNLLQNDTVFFRCFYSNGLEEIEREYTYGQNIQTIIYDNG